MGDPMEAVTLLEEALKHKTQKEVAALLDVDAKTVSRWKSGKVQPSSVVALALREIAGKPKKSAQEGHDFTFIDLFAGIGGIRMGFQQHGGKCVFTSEWNTWSQKTYAANFGDDHEINGDITKIDEHEIPDHDVLLAGFPCQPFSIAGVSKKNALGRPHGFECTTQGTLFFDVARIIAAKRPKAFLLENVKNLLSHDKGNTFRIIMETLRNELGYKVEARVIDAKHFVPQHRINHGAVFPRFFLQNRRDPARAAGEHWVTPAWVKDSMQGRLTSVCYRPMTGCHPASGTRHALVKLPIA